MNKLKRTTQEVADYFASFGCKLLGPYTGVMNKMKYRCKCGVISSISYNKFSGGRRCGYCHSSGRKKKYSHTEVSRIFEGRGCELLGKYQHIHKPVEYRCQCGKIAKITFAAFYHQNQFCRECGLEKNKKEGHHAWVQDRVLLRERQLFSKKCYKALSSSLKAIGKKKVGKTSDMLGYGPKELQDHISKHPNWELVKHTNWHLDHIFPIEGFLEHGIKDIQLINALDNLQPITQKENNAKHAKYNKQKFRKWLRGKGVGL